MVCELIVLIASVKSGKVDQHMLQKINPFKQRGN